MPTTTSRRSSTTSTRGCTWCETYRWTRSSRPALATRSSAATGSVSMRCRWTRTMPYQRPSWARPPTPSSWLCRLWSAWRSGWTIGRLESSRVAANSLVSNRQKRPRPPIWTEIARRTSQECEMNRNDRGTSPWATWMASNWIISMARGPLERERDRQLPPPPPLPSTRWTYAIAMGNAISKMRLRAAIRQRQLQ